MKRIPLMILAGAMGAGLGLGGRASAQEQPPLLASASTPAAVSAQGDKPSPLPPYLASVPEYGHWTVTFKYGEAASPGDAASAGGEASPEKAALGASGGAPSLIETTKAGDIRSVSLTFLKGAPKQYTCRGDWVLWSTSSGAQMLIADLSHVPYMYYTQGYVLMEDVTIGAATYQGYEEYNNVPAFHYKSGETDVWIDVATMLPLVVKKGDVEADYQFIPTTKKIALKIPRDQAELLQQGVVADKYVRSLR